MCNAKKPDIKCLWSKSKTGIGWELYIFWKDPSYKLCVVNYRFEKTWFNPKITSNKIYDGYNCYFRMNFYGKITKERKFLAYISNIYSMNLLWKTDRSDPKKFTIMTNFTDTLEKMANTNNLVFSRPEGLWVAESSRDMEDDQILESDYIFIDPKNQIKNKFSV